MTVTSAIHCGDCLEVMRGMPAQSVDLVFGSPPYEAARTYGIAFKLKGQEWVDWMVERMVEMLRVCRGLVAMVVEGQTRAFRWTATPALLMADLHHKGIHLRKPPVFHRIGIAGSGGPDWLRSDTEWIVCCTNGGKLPWSDNTAMGHHPRWAPGGAMSHRTSNGARVNQWGHSFNSGGTGGKKDEITCQMPRPSHKRLGRGNPKGACYTIPVKANPGNTFQQTYTADEVAEMLVHQGDMRRYHVGGGLMGSDLAHENEAPFPEKLAEFFVRSFCPPQVCNLCGTPVQYQHENKTMRDVPKNISHRKLATSVLLSGVSKSGLQDGTNNSEMRNVREEVQDAHFSPGSQKVLQQGVPAQVVDENTGEVQVLQEANTADETQSAQHILFKDMRSQEFGPVSPAAICDVPRLRGGVSAGTSDGNQSRLCDGTQTCDGQTSEAQSDNARSGPSQKRKKGRQQTGQSCANEKGSTRPFAKAKKSTNVSQMRVRNGSESLCPSCGADLSLPNAVRPGVVLDPFSGSGTTGAAALKAGRNFIGIDIRESQVALTKRRIAEIQTELFA